MCGISGIVNRSNAGVPSSDIQRMNDLIQHRGPDDEGYFHHDCFAFGHRRLAILDLTVDGHQPMHYLSKYTITYNGEIYNYVEIREALQKEGYIFHSETDTEVILASYDHWGEGCVTHFNGMWAFAIFDHEKNRIFCSRDRFGVKPFYYTEVGERFVFGSEIKQLLEFHPQRYVNRVILADYLLYGLEEHTHETFFKGVFKLEQAHNLVYDLHQHTYEIYPYYDITYDGRLDHLSEAESVGVIQQELERSIALRLRSDVRVGTCLSGGLDSSSITAIASQQYYDKTGERFMAIHAKSVEAKTDESQFAQEVARQCPVNLIEVEPTLEEITAHVEEVVYTQEEPFGGPSIFMQYFVMQQANLHQCPVMLDGQGGDETLFGYEGYYSFYFASLLKRFRPLRYLRELSRLHTFKISKKRIVRDSLIVMVRNTLSFLEQRFWKRKTFLKIDVDRKRLDHLFELMTFKGFQKREIMVRNLPHLLRYEDKNSMRHSIETRLPFVDYAFVEHAIGLNEAVKFKDGFLKYILRRAVEPLLPSSIVWRKNKFGFEAPTDLWIASHRDEMLQVIQNSMLLHHCVEITDALLANQKQLWKLYNIAVWEKVYGVVFEA